MSSGLLLISLALLATPAQVPNSPRPRTEVLLPESTASHDAVLRWNEAALQAIKAANTPPPLASRHLAILHVAMDDAVTGVRHACRPFEVELAAPPGTY